jgi:uncharacterized protein YycO
MAPSLPLPKIGQVVLTEGVQGAVLSTSISYFTNSLWTHAFLVTGANEAVEAWLPRIRKVDLRERMDRLYNQGRAYAILDLPLLPRAARETIAEKANTYVGKLYDVRQTLTYALFGEFRGGSDNQLLCSRIITAAFYSCGENLFDEATLCRKLPPAQRLPNLRQGYATPVDLLFSRLSIVRFQPSIRLPVPKAFIR